ncbi:energy-coupling factor transport system ATP-binding protein [Paraoerskovia marina]|uniref:Energy-coupling factor transport system ATP-binding protein n=1 Tax=Paraoerskovia marina TaxID=545619 RepID=A0A1H1RPU1_9CELL|nr:ATP-binding cassette domain-containing protein [Paraoerskovia marina]SDS37781.1 energy-coupling factor transport system ATP-binding protein [Paraoerskovia marina]
MTASDGRPASDLAALLDMRDVAVRHVLEDGETVEVSPRATPDGVSLRVDVGEVVLLLGPSGSGKSTLALAANGLVPHVVPARMDGTVQVGGRDTRTHEVPTLSSAVATVFQDPDAQVVTGSVLDEVCFGPENLLLPVAEIERRAELALRQVGLWERRAEAPERLSGGGRQRLAIACALALGSPLLVLDEPTANLDPAGKEEVYDVVREIAASGRHGVLLVEHDLDAAADLVDRVVVLDGSGRQVVSGPLRTVLSEHIDELVALGVWLPVATLAAVRLGLRDRQGNLPVTPDELATLLSSRSAAGRLPEPRVDAARSVAPGATVIDVDGLTVRARRRTIVDDVSFRVTAGELLAVVGANGAGKTTLLKAVAGVTRPPRRTVRIAGLDPARADVADLASRVGYVFQNPEHQFVTGSVRAELRHGLTVRGIAPDESEVRVEEMLERFGLTDLAARHPFLLSGGQKRRLSVGTAMICRPEVLVLDEPTYGQDRERAAELLGLLDALHSEGTTVVLVTHDMQVVADHATRVIALADGRIEADGPPGLVLSDQPLMRRCHLRAPHLARATSHLPAPWNTVTRLADVPLSSPTAPQTVEISA